MNRFHDWTTEDLRQLDRETEVQRRELGSIQKLVSDVIFSGSYHSVFAQRACNEGSDWLDKLIALHRRHEEICAEIRAIADRIRPQQAEQKVGA